MAMRQRCIVCGAEGGTETMHFCPTDGMWVCSACTVCFGLADSAPRCPRCYEVMVVEMEDGSARRSKITNFITGRRGKG